MFSLEFCLKKQGFYISAEFLIENLAAAKDLNPSNSSVDYLDNALSVEHK